MDALQLHAADRWIPFGPVVDSEPPEQGGQMRSASFRPMPSDDQFVEMLQAYRASGGIARRGEIESRLMDRSSLGRHVLATWIDDGAVFAFDWRGQTWLPCFQFQASTMTPRMEVIQVLRELGPVFDGAEMAVWFSKPHELLRGRTPVESLDAEAVAVRQAARFDRYVAS